LPYLSGSGGGVIAFVSERTGNYEIYVMAVPDGTDADGAEQGSGDPLRLTKNPAHDGCPKWSPDGMRIAFASNRTGNWDIYVMNVRDALQGVGDSSLQRLTENAGNNLSPAWSPDGTQMAFVSTRAGNHEIYVMNIDGTDPRRLTTDDAEDWCPAWSPDGARIAFYSERDGNQEIYVVSVPDGTGVDGAEQGSGDLQRLTHDDADDFHAAWSPDSTQIAFISGREGSGNVYVMNSDGSDPRRLTDTRGGDESPTWSPDGTRIAFASEHDGNGEIYIVGVQGALRSEGADVSDLQRLTQNHVGDYCPAWRPHGNNGGP
jgi:TolB protein